MPEKEYKFTVPYQVRSYEVDYLQEATISTICNYFQEAAGLHAQQLHFDISDLQKKGLTWILYKLQVKVHKFPTRWDSIKVTTWPSTGDGIRAYRDYQLYDSEEELLAVGLSQWMVMDIQKKRPVKMPGELMSERFATNKHVLDLHKKSLPNFDGEDSELVTIASINDLDMNRHVNNVRYIDWLTGYNLSGKFKDKKCTGLVIQYAAETKAGDKIYMASKSPSNDENEISFSLFKNNARTVIANATTTWT